MTLVKFPNIAFFYQLFNDRIDVYYLCIW